MYKILDLAEGALVETYYKEGRERRFHFTTTEAAISYLRYYINTNKAATGRHIHEYEIIEVPDV